MLSLTTPVSSTFDVLRHSPQLLANARRRLFDRDSLVAAGKTPFDVIHRHGTVSLRYYPALTDAHITLADGSTQAVAQQTHHTPLVLVPPLAVNMLVYDLFPERSLVRYLRARGFDLYMVDWGTPSWSDNKRHLADYFASLLREMLNRVRFHSGRSRLNLHGWSLGGLFALCHAAMADPDTIANLVLVGAPVDYHNNGILGERYKNFAHAARQVRARTGLTAHRLPTTLLRSPGWLNSLAFKLTSPVASVRNYQQLLANLHDTEYVASNATNAAFLDGMVAYTGGAVADFIDYFWVENRLASGRLPMRQPSAGLDRVRAPILNITGRDDPIVTPSCSQAMQGLVSSTDVTCRSVAGGHVGIVSSALAQRETWPQIVDWLIARDG